MARRSMMAAHLAAAATLMAAQLQAWAGTIDSAVAGSLAMRPMGAIRVLIRLRDAAPLERVTQNLAGKPMRERPGLLAAALRERFDSKADPLRARLQSLGGQDLQSLWLVDAIAAEMPRSRVHEVAAWPEVERIELDMALRSQQVIRTRTLPTAAQAADAVASAALAAARRQPATPVDWRAAKVSWQLPEHLAALDVVRAWQRGYAGRAMTVAVVDSGVDVRTPTLAQAYRGGAHDWLDPYGQHKLPHDGQGHGSLVTSLLVAPPVDQAPLGIAPEARFIAARLFDDAGQGRLSAVHRIYQWMLDPDGRPDTHDAPQVVNNSWGFAQTTDQCDSALQRIWDAYRAVGIPVVFAAGNDGPMERTTMSPANNARVISVGALDADGFLARQSSRGPSACLDAATGRPLPFPSLHAPGISLPTLDRVGLSMGTVNRSDGTSFAAALVSGSLALLRQAHPEAEVDELVARLTRHASAADAQRPPVLQVSAALDRPGSGATASDSTRVPQRIDLARSADRIVLDAGSLGRALPRALRITQIAADGPVPDSVIETIGPTHWVWAPSAAGAEVLRLRLALSDGTVLPLEVRPQASQVAGDAAASTRMLAGRRDTPVPIDVAALAGPGADPKALQWSQPLRGGRIERGEDGETRYRPPQGFVGTDQFALRGGPGGDVTVKVLVRP